jgi:DNA-binding response OmpR family regulator
MKHRLLAVDDQELFLDTLRRALSSHFEVYTATNGVDALIIARREKPAVILLDVVLVNEDGIDLCRTLRTDPETRDILVLMLSGLDDMHKRIDAYMAGVDDFLQKPIHMDELRARVVGLLRRRDEARPAPQESACLQVGNLELDSASMEVRISGVARATSVLEFNLLKFLLINRGRVVTRPEILRNVWHGVAVSERTIDTHIAVLRKKLEGFDHRIKTIYGAGYIVKPGGGSSEE